MSAALFPLAIQREQASQSDPDLATQQTVDKMIALIQSASNDPAIDDACNQAVRRSAMIGRTFYPGRTTLQSCIAVWTWIKKRVAFVEDNVLVRKLLGADQDQLDLLIAPSALLRMTPACGDCATFTMLVSAMLNALGIDNQIAAAATNPNEPSIFNHAYCQVPLPEGGIFVMDVSHGQYPGWEVPKERIFRKQTWDVPRSLTVQSADAQGTYRGLHGVTPAPTVRGGGVYGVNPFYTRNAGGRRFRRRRGMGDDTVIDSTTGLPVSPNYADPSLTYGPPTPIPTASSASTLPSWLNFFGNIFKSSTPLIQQAMLPTGGYIQSGPGGTVIANAVPGAIPGGVSVAASGMSGTTLLLLGGGLLVLMLVGGKH